MKYWVLVWALFFSLGLLVVGVMVLAVVREGYYRIWRGKTGWWKQKFRRPEGKSRIKKGGCWRKAFTNITKSSQAPKFTKAAAIFRDINLKGRILAYDLKRQYTYQESMGLVTGYVGMATADELNNNPCGAKLDADEW